MRLFVPLCTYCSIVLCCVLALPLSAQTSEKNVSLTFSPAHLFAPMLEITGEFRIGEGGGIAGIVGFGSIRGIPVLELGGQYHYYIVGGFEHGMQCGGELTYFYASRNIRRLDRELAATAMGVALSPYIGYKIAVGFGLTFYAQVGASVVLSRGTVVDDEGERQSSRSASKFSGLLNLNVGWSF